MAQQTASSTTQNPANATATATGGFSPQPYDPNSLQPYTPPPEPQLPAVTAPPTQDTGGGLEQRGMRPVFGGGGKAVAGSIAYIGDSILRGWMKGREQAERAKADKLNRLQQGLRYNYENAARSYVGMIESGADPNSKEVQQAKSARDAAWQMLMQMQGNYVFGDGKGKGGGGGGGGGLQPGFDPGMSGERPKKSKKGSSTATGPDGQPDIGALLQSKDPREKAQGYFLLAMKAGPPDEYQAQQVIARRKAFEADPDQQMKQMEGEVIKIRRDPNATPEKIKRADELEKQISSMQQSFSGRVPPKPSYSTFDIPGAQLAGRTNPDGTSLTDAFGNAIDPKQQYREETVGDQKRYIPSVHKESAADLPRKAWAKDEKGHIYSVNVDKRTNQPIAGTENYKDLPPAQIPVDSIRSGEFTYTDETGQTFRVPYTTQTHKGTGTAAAPAAAGGGGTAHAPAAHTGAGANTPAHNPAASAAAAAEGGQPAGPAGSRYIGKKESADERTLRTNAVRASEKIHPMVTLLNAADEYYKAGTADDNKFDSAGDLGIIVQAVRSMNPGSVRLPQTELSMEMQRGTFGERFERWEKARIENGKLPDKFRDELIGVIRREATQAATEAAGNWDQAFGGTKPMPPWLQPFSKTTPQGGNAGGGGTGTQHKVGDVVKVGGQNIEITAMHADGTFDGKPMGGAAATGKANGKANGNATATQSAKPGAHKVNDIVTVKGQKVRITKLLPDGKYEGEPVQ